MSSSPRSWERRALKTLAAVGAVVLLLPVIDAVVVFGFVALGVRVLRRAWTSPDGVRRENAGPTYVRLHSDCCYIRRCAVVGEGLLEFELVAYGASFDGFDAHGAYREQGEEWEETVVSLRIEVDSDEAGPLGFEEIADQWRHQFVQMAAETVVPATEDGSAGRIPADLLSIRLDGGEGLGTLSTTRTPP